MLLNRRTLLHSDAVAHTQLIHRRFDATKLAESTSQYNFVLQSLHRGREGARGGERATSTTSYYKAWTKHFPVLLCTTKPGQSTSQYYFVLQSLHKVLPSTALYYNACARHFPVLLCTTKLAQKVVPSTTLYYKAHTKYFLVLLRTTTLAQSISQYNFVLQSLHRGREGARGQPVLLRPAKLAESTSQYCFVLQSLHENVT